MKVFQKPYTLGDVVLVYSGTKMYLGIIESSQKMMDEAKYSVHPIGAWFRHDDLALVTPCDEMSWDLLQDKNHDEETDEDDFPRVAGADISSEIDPRYKDDDMDDEEWEDENNI